MCSLTLQCSIKTVTMSWKHKGKHDKLDFCNVCLYIVNQLSSNYSQLLNLVL
uniref:Uncharacterized protein n=1 Tax=Anguilla anguilla TaxID=7936 RepID=A0A0E9WHY5_ANGAN